MMDQVNRRSANTQRDSTIVGVIRAEALAFASALAQQGTLSSCIGTPLGHHWCCPEHRQGEETYSGNAGGQHGDKNAIADCVHHIGTLSN